jgi:hypothetical protein
VERQEDGKPRVSVRRETADDDVPRPHAHLDPDDPLLLAATPATAGREADGCRQGRFVVTEGAAARGGEPAVLVLDGAAVRVDGTCPTTGKLLKSVGKARR